MFEAEFVDYGPCLSCKKPTLVCPTHQVENGLICTDCRLKEQPCGWFAGQVVHHFLCPKSPFFDRRKTRSNRPRCNLGDGEATDQ